MVGLGPVRNQVSAAKKLQTPSRTATTIIMLVPFAAANKLLRGGELLGRAALDPLRPGSASLGGRIQAVFGASERSTRWGRLGLAGLRRLAVHLGRAARAGWAIASVVAARCGSRALLLGLTPFLRVRTCRVG